MKKSPNKLQRQRNGLLAIVHIAKKDLGLDDAAYRDVLGFWGVKSSGALSISELEELIDYFSSRGFQKKTTGDRRQKADGRRRMIEALHERIQAEAAKLENGDARMNGLIKAKANVDDLRFCRNINKLKQILRILKLFQEQEKEQTTEDR